MTDRIPRHERPMTAAERTTLRAKVLLDPECYKATEAQRSAYGMLLDYDGDDAQITRQSREEEARFTRIAVAHRAIMVELYAAELHRNKARSLPAGLTSEGHYGIRGNGILRAEIAAEFDANNFVHVPGAPRRLSFTLAQQMGIAIEYVPLPAYVESGDPEARDD